VERERPRSAESCARAATHMSARLNARPSLLTLYQAPTLAAAHVRSAMPATAAVRKKANRPRRREATHTYENLFSFTNELRQSCSATLGVFSDASKVPLRSAAARTARACGFCSSASGLDGHQRQQTTPTSLPRLWGFPPTSHVRPATNLTSRGRDMPAELSSGRVEGRSPRARFPAASRSSTHVGASERSLVFQ